MIQMAVRNVSAEPSEVDKSASQLGPTAVVSDANAAGEDYAV